MLNCPSDADLERLARDDSAAGTAMRTHAADCVRCRDRLDAVREEEALLAPLRVAYQRLRAGAGNGSSADLSLPADGAPPSQDSSDFRDSPWTRNEAGSAAPACEIPGFKILRRIGEGGMGIVYEAEQQHPRRLVAVKLVRGGALADPLRNRLIEREAAALARLKHPAIAAVYGAGCTDDGLNYVVMELVRGWPLTAFAAETQMPLPDRLRLFEQIARAIHVAHQHGVIHLDLKPANILVEAGGAGGAAPVPKILDFGLARIIDSGDDQASLHAGVDRIRGTLAYMSPQQASGRADEIDYRSDIYSLGAVLYELLTGQRPHDLKELPLLEAVRRIRETDAMPPSRHDGRLRGDLDTIVLKALSRDPSERYEDAGALAADVARYLARQPIAARPPSLSYVALRFAQRHAVGCAFTAILVLLVAGFALYSSNQASHIVQARGRAGQMQKTLQSLLSNLDPAKTGSPETPLRRVLDDAVDQLQVMEDQPEASADLRITIGQSYAALGMYAPAEAQFRAALAARRELFGSRHASVAEALHELGLVLKHADRSSEADAAYAEALDIRRALLPPDHEDIAKLLNDLGSLRMDQFRVREAEKLIRESLDILQRISPVEDGRLATALGNLGMVLFFQRKYEEAAPLMRRALEMRERLFGKDDPGGIEMLSNYAVVMMHVNKDMDAAESYMREALSRRRRVEGPTHPEVLRDTLNLSRVLRARDKIEEADRLVAEVRAIRSMRAVAASRPHVAEP